MKHPRSQHAAFRRSNARHHPRPHSAIKKDSVAGRRVHAAVSWRVSMQCGVVSYIRSIELLIREVDINPTPSYGTIKVLVTLKHLGKERLLKSGRRPTPRLVTTHIY